MFLGFGGRGFELMRLKRINKRPFTRKKGLVRLKSTWQTLTMSTSVVSSLIRKLGDKLFGLKLANTNFEQKKDPCGSIAQKFLRLNSDLGWWHTSRAKNCRACEPKNNIGLYSSETGKLTEHFIQNH